MNNGFKTLCTGDEALNMFAVGLFLVESSQSDCFVRAMGMLTSGGAQYIWTLALKCW